MLVPYNDAKQKFRNSFAVAPTVAVKVPVNY